MPNQPHQNLLKVCTRTSAQKLPKTRLYRETKGQEFTEKRNATRNHKEEAAPIATSSGTLSSLASCGWPSARTRWESTCFRRIRHLNPPPHPLPPRPLLPDSNAIKIAGDAGDTEPVFFAGFDQKAEDTGISSHGHAAIGRSEKARWREMGTVRARRRQLPLSLSGFAAQSRFSPLPCVLLVSSVLESCWLRGEESFFFYSGIYTWTFV